MTAPLPKYKKVLNKALALLKGGQCWTKNDYKRFDDAANAPVFCAVGAIREAGRRLGCSPTTAITKLAENVRSCPETVLESWKRISKDAMTVIYFNDGNATFPVVRDMFVKAANS